MGTKTFTCADCGTEINEGEYKSFGVCDSCFDKGVSQKLWEANHRKSQKAIRTAITRIQGGE